MEFNLTAWLTELTDKVKSAFGDRVKFIGLQGSYRRGEANEQSDIDVIVILDKLSVADLKVYKSAVTEMPYGEKACGFISGEKELFLWPKYDIFHLWHDTEPIYGDLMDLIPEIRREDVVEAVQIGAANLYHAAGHSYLYDKDRTKSLLKLYKPTFFILQAAYFLKENDYIITKQELLQRLNGEDEEILTLCMDHEFGDTPQELENCYEKLIGWCARMMGKDSE